MVVVTYNQAVVTGIGEGMDEDDFKNTKQVIFTISRGVSTPAKDTITTIHYLNQVTQEKYALRGERWAGSKQKQAQWAHNSHLGVEKCVVKFTLDFFYGMAEIETYGRKDIYQVIEQIRITNFVSESIHVDLQVYSVIKDIRDNGNVEEIEIEVVSCFDGLKSREVYEKKNRFLLSASGQFQDLV
eukprot:TRINITY_DN10181_c0_g1_i1.p1 TRINITY_DN10181_c0_g1~~TRINITY_DN10181_c0_g1_i1.p1  ORF type:complete len:185 (+),score=56.90 TRINITY_DN10181_c0_g1_i1:58-612(+)